MSSAAVQSQSSSQYYQQDRYPNSTTSPSRRSGNASIPNTPQQPQYSSPLSSAATMSTPRGPTAASPSEPMSTSTYQQFYPDSVASGPPAALPIRTSSQQAPTSVTASPYDSRAYGSRSQQSGGGYGSESERERSTDNERRQRSQRSPQVDQSGASRGSQQRSRNAPTQSRSATAVGQPPVDTTLPRENSAIITHIVVDDPQADYARERARIAEARPHQSGTEPAMVDQTIPADTEQKHRSRQEHLRQPAHRKEVKFGDYILGQTLGEGEFGKVKMGWKKDSSVQVAIKLIRKESLQSNSSRLPKIYREIGILRDLQHPNIVRLHEFVETERHMGIILEYASGGELFDYILNHRYLKDPAARRLFAQLVSGVGYLHKKGIVHRDLKLENLLLDRNKNIIITDFGFANTFNPVDELPEEVEHRIGDKDFVKREGLDKTNDKGMRRGDLMQTSCGSPCYAAPELVVSDGLYTGRKVDVWSCGVILVSRAKPNEVKPY
jgi:protein-serine/threonine kinase